jgi:RNA polymerase sigma-70 factor (ECF subfamily)
MSITSTHIQNPVRSNSNIYGKTSIHEKGGLISSHALPGDAQKGIRQLFERYSTHVFNVCMRMLGNRQEADDITQDVFVRAFNAYTRFRGEADPGTWLYRIAVNLCLNHQAKQKRRQWLSIDFLQSHSGEFSFPDREIRADERVQKEALERHVQDAINLLPERQRVALILSRYEELSYQKIAETMDCSISSVESLIHRAKQNLAKRLRPYMDHYRD